MTDEKSDNSKTNETAFDTDPPGHVGEDTTIVLKNAEDDPQASKIKPQGRALGTTIGGHYRLESRIGSGGSSAVYLATDLSLGRKVAVKLLLSGAYFSDEERLRFQREGRAVGSLDHPHIVRIFEFNTTENDEPFLVMEYLQGKSLADIVKERGAIPVEETLDCIAQVVQALAYAHKRGIVHRDIKSSNIVIVEDADHQKVAKVVDFGLARPDEETGKGLTLTGTIFGSPLYMSPEQCRGERVDARSDIYSLGCVIYECLTGHVPFNGASIMETFRMHIDERPAPIAGKLKSVNNAADIEKVVFRCLEKNPADRYQEAERLEEDLKRLEKMTRSGVLASATSLARELRSGATGQFKKNRKIWIALIIFFAGLVGIPLLRPQIITEAADNYWRSIDLKAQQAFDEGDYQSAEKNYQHSLDFAAYAPVSKREVRKKETIQGQLDLAFALEQKDRIATLSEQLKELKRSNPDAPEVAFEGSMPMLLKSVEKLKALKATEEKEEKLGTQNKSSPQLNSGEAQESASAKAAAEILDRANDAAEVMIEDGQVIEAGRFLKTAYENTIDYLPDTNDAVPRSLINLVSITINTDPLRAFVYMTKCQNLVYDQSKKFQPLARARFLSELGRSYLLALMPHMAYEPLKKAVSIYAYQYALTGAGAGTAYLRLAEAQIRLGDPANASASLELAERAFHAEEKTLPGNSLRCQLTKAEILIRTGKVKDGVDILDRELLRQEKRFPTRHMDLTETLYFYTRLMMKVPYSTVTEKKARCLAARVCGMWESRGEYAFASTIWMALSKYDGDNRKLLQAEKSMLRALADFKKMKSFDYYSQVSVYSNLGELQLRKADYKGAYANLKIAEEYLTKAKSQQIGSIVGTTGASDKFLYRRLADVTEKLGLREENKKYNELLESSF